MTFSFVPERESMTISRRATLEYPVGPRHVTIVLVVHEADTHTVDPRVTEDVGSKLAKLTPDTLTRPPPVSGEFFGWTNVTTGESYEKT
jgi:hypothetical protein